MFNILIIDDQEFKIRDIKKQINSEKAKVEWSSDLFESKQLIKQNSYNIIILDITIREGLSKNEFKGLDILDFMEDEEINSAVIVLTQFFNFNDLSLSMKQRGYSIKNDFYHQEIEYNCPTDIDLHYLPNLHIFLSQNYENYFGSILYVQNDIIWVECLKKMLFELGGIDYESIIIR